MDTGITLVRKTNFEAPNIDCSKPSHLPQLPQPFLMIKALHSFRTSMMLLAMTLLTQVGWGQLFQQQFGSALSSTSNTSLTTGTYFASSPTNAQFTGFTSSGTGSSISIASNQMTLVRSGNGWGFVRGSAFSGPPSSLIIRFDFSNTSSVMPASSK
mgnify:CR=1 FL=1